MELVTIEHLGRIDSSLFKYDFAQLDVMRNVGSVSSVELNKYFLGWVYIRFVENYTTYIEYFRNISRRHEVIDTLIWGRLIEDT